jgi:hypothetical protein
MLSRDEHGGHETRPRILGGGCQAEARYEAKPVVDTLANRWGESSAAF